MSSWQQEKETEDLSLSCQSFLWPAYEYYALEYKMLLATLPTFNILHSRLETSRVPRAHLSHTYTGNISSKYIQITLTYMS